MINVIKMLKQLYIIILRITYESTHIYIYTYFQCGPKIKNKLVSL